MKSVRTGPKRADKPALVAIAGRADPFSIARDIAAKGARQWNGRGAPAPGLAEPRLVAADDARRG